MYQVIDRIVNHEELSSEEKVLFLGRCMDVVFGKSVNIVPDYYLRYEGDYDDFHLALWYRKRDVDGRATPVKLELDDEQIISFMHKAYVEEKKVHKKLVYK